MEVVVYHNVRVVSPNELLPPDSSHMSGSASLTGVIMGLLMYLAIPEIPVDKGGRIDYAGAVLGLSSLLLLNIVCK